MFRGFHHRGLCDTCPQAGLIVAWGCRSGQVSHNPKLIESFALQALGDRSCQEQPLSPAGLTDS